MHKSLQAESKLRVNKMRAGSCKPDQFQFWGSGETVGGGQRAALRGSSPLLLAASPRGPGQSSLAVSVSLLGFSLLSMPKLKVEASGNYLLVDIKIR